MNSPLVHIGMASIPKRAEACKKTIMSILRQDYPNFKMWVSLNSYGKIPTNWPKDERLIYRLRENKLGDAEKFYPFHQEGSNLLFTIDDDIKYPENYLSTMLEWFDKFNGRCAIAAHGSILARGFKSWLHDRWVSHFTAAQKQHTQMHILGTGTTLFNKEWLRGYKFAEWKNMSDIGTSLHLRRRGIARISVRRPKKWLKAIGNVTAVCYTTANLQRLAAKLKPHLPNFQKEVSRDDGIQSMKAATKNLPRNSIKTVPAIPRLRGEISPPKPIKPKPRSRAAAIKKPQPQKAVPRRKRG